MGYIKYTNFTIFGPEVNFVILAINIILNKVQGPLQKVRIGGGSILAQYVPMVSHGDPIRVHFYGFQTLPKWACLLILA